MRHFRPIAIGFLLVIIAIILIADLGLGQKWFALLYTLPNADVLGHFLLLGLLSLLVSLGFPAGRVRLAGLPLLKTVLLIAAVITLEELSQIFLANRSFSLLDLAANYAGIFTLGELGAYVHQRHEPL